MDSNIDGRSLRSVLGNIRQKSLIHYWETFTEKMETDVLNAWYTKHDVSLLKHCLSFNL